MSSKDRNKNPFASFVAGGGDQSTMTSSGGDWLSTKRVGRDDDQIAKDREIARESRRNHRTTTQPNKPKSKKTVAATKKKARRRHDSSDEDDSDSMGSFLAADEEHEEEVSESEADWDDELEGDESSSEEEDNTVKNVATTSSKRRKGVQKPARISNGSSVSASTSRSKKRMEVIECSSDDSDNTDCDEKKEEDTPLPNKKKVTSSFFSKVPPLKKISQAASSSTILLSSSSEDELEIIDSPPPRKPLQSGAAKRLRQEQMARNRVNHKDDSSSSEDEDLFGTMKQGTANPPVVQQSHGKEEESDCAYEDNNMIGTNDTDEEEEDPMLKRAIQQSLKYSPKKQARVGHSSFLCDSSDEDMEAIELAKKASLKDVSKKRLRKGKSNDVAQTKKIKTLKATKKTKTAKVVRTKVVEVLSSSSDEDEGNGNDDEKQESYNYEEEEDANHKEASKVLQIANSLSATVLNRMQSWAGQVQETQTTKSSHDDDRGGGAKLPELIVDGALSLVRLHRDIDEPVHTANAGMETAQGQGATSSMGEQWISNDTMCRLCPKIKLADYQLIGVNWMALLHSMKCDLTQKNGDMVASGGNADSEDDDDEEYGKAPKKKNSRNGKKANVNGVLADEMGLGKTVQTIAFLAWLKFGCKKAATNPHIIVVPASVLGNWEKEFKIVCPELVVVKYHGSMPEREQIRYRLKKALSGQMPLDVILTTYSYFSGEKADDRNFLRKFHFEYMIVDEAHCLKNPRGMRYQNLDRVNTEHRLLLTGTPVQNSPKELMSLLCFLMPLFSSQQSRDDRDGGEEMLEHFISIESENISKKDAGSDRDREARGFRKLKQLLAPFILRRLKCNVGLQGLPPKVRKVEFVPFDKSSCSLYDSIISSHLNKGTKDENGERIEGDQCQHIFTALRKAANHPLLLRTRHKSKDDIDDLSNILFLQGYFGRDATCTEELVKRELKGFSDFDVHCAALELIENCKALEPRLSRFTLSEEDLFCSPKFTRLRSLVPKLVTEGHRVLIFSQWTRCLDLLGCLMDSIHLPFFRLDGQTDIKERQSMIDEFNNDPSIPIFLLSTRAGGLGLNLTAADTVILHDLDFNPFNDIQAEDRCHRFGQTKAVTIYKLVTEGTVDADIYSMQERKARMNAAIFENEGESTGKNKAKKKSEDKEAMASILQTAVDRFLLSPSI